MKKYVFIFLSLLSAKFYSAVGAERDLFQPRINTFYEVEGSCGIGTAEFNEKLSLKISKLHGKSELFDFLLIRSDETGQMIRVNYLRGRLVVIHGFLGESGMIIARTVFRQNRLSGRFEVSESSMYLLEGVHIFSEDLVPLDESSYWHRAKRNEQPSEKSEPHKPTKAR